MGSKKFTFIELHLDGDTQFGPKQISDALPTIGSDVDVEEGTLETPEETETEVESDESPSAKPVAVLAGLLALVAVALVAKKIRGGDDEDEETFETVDEPDIIVD
ncbi:hypothetical protein [Natronobiforma cellulositropha]|uniref:hypothetical protein n=1 Tax=Natronobiforma cellulositropha TaxID=1679076 RepID=UPI0021D582C0|nr:hypothetical protein [Natronobiforma cellulositropha]